MALFPVQAKPSHLLEHGEANPENIRPGETPVASDSGSTKVGVDNKSTNLSGESGISGEPRVRSEPDEIGQAKEGS